MIADAPRMDAYVRALRQTVKPGSVVVDLGCGPGMFALIACQLGARRVFAIEPANVIQVARDAARQHGFAERIEFFEELSTKITLPEKADVIVSDLHGVLPWFGHHLDSIIDARARFLAPGGVLLPRCDKLWAALVEIPERYNEIVGPWDYNGLKLKSARALAVNTWSKFRVRPENLLGQPVCWNQLDFHHVENRNFCKEVSLTPDRRATVHGLAIWFDAELIDGIGFSNAPGDEELIYGQALFPLKEPVEVGPGDQVEVRLEARLIDDDYVWRWDTSIPSKQISFKQSTLFGTPLSASQLQKRANTYVPQTNEAGAIARFVLSQMGGTNSIEQIAAELVRRFPHHENDALNLVAEISEKYSV